MRTLPALLLLLGANDPPLVDLDASGLAPGAVAEWANRGSLGGGFRAEGEKRPAAGDVGGRRAVTFEGGVLRSAFDTPPSLSGDGPFTVEAWAWNPRTGGPETVLAWGRHPDGFAEFRYGSTVREAFAGTGAPHGGVRGTPPAEGAWHLLTWVYTPGTLRLYVGGALVQEKACTLRARPEGPLTLGGGWEGRKGAPVALLSGSVARVRVHARALSTREVRNAAGLHAAFSPRPADGAVVEDESVALAWEAGDPEGRSFRLHVGDARDRLEPREDPRLGLTLGKTYYWRVDTLDASGAVRRPGEVWSFTASAGPAKDPRPPDRRGGVRRDTRELLWTPGKHSVAQAIHFGTDAAPVREGPPAARLDAKADRWTVPPLAPGTTYYWRVASDNGDRPSAPGEVWSFRTEDERVRNELTFIVASDPHFGLSPETDAVNYATIDAMHELPGARFPEKVGGGIIPTPRGVLLTGDLVENGNARDGAEQWKAFEAAYGVSGEGYCQYPVFEGFGNHDGNADRPPRLGVKARNARRPGLARISENGLHYSWDWDDFHFVSVNLYVGSRASPAQEKRGSWTDPQKSLEFLREDLAASVGKSGRPVLIYHHYGFDGYSNGWYAEEERQAYFEAIKDYNVIAIFYGHTHGVGAMKWNGVDAYNAPAAQPAPGRFLVVRVTREDLVVAERKGAEWGLSWRKSLKLPLLRPQK